MARIAGINIPPQQHAEIGLTAIFGIGRARARDYTFPGGVDVPELRQPRAPELKLITRKAIKPSEAEVVENPRSRSAQLRVMEKI